MESTNLTSDGEGQDTGIRVDLDAEDGKAVIRNRPQSPPRADKSDAKSEDDIRYSKAVKARIQRVQRGFDQRLADQQAEFQRQLAERDDRLKRLETGRTETPTTDEAAHQKALDDLQAQLEEAQERGDSKTVAKLTRDLSSLDAKFWAARTAQQTQGASENKTRQEAQAATSPAKRAPTKAGVAWAKANAEWWNDRVDPVARRARALANEIHAEKLEADDDPEDPEYFEEIGREVRKTYPDVGVVTAVKKQRRGAEIDEDHDEADGDDDVAPTRRALPTQSRGDPTPSQRRSNIRSLTQADQRTMRQLGMNPDDNKHVLQWLRSAEEGAEA